MNANKYQTLRAELAAADAEEAERVVEIADPAKDQALLASLLSDTGGQNPRPIEDIGTSPAKPRLTAQPNWFMRVAAGISRQPALALSAVAVGRWLGASGPTVLSLAPKSATTPIAMGVAEQIGGIPSLTAVLVIATGIFGAVLAIPLFDRLRVRDPAVRGFALGVASHGIGTARAFQIDEETGAFAALAMGLNGVFTALAVPALAAWLL
ncbi:MAG TPA: LrgB family protein [Rhodocyclaceae bacterium]|nr:LrgB family protein [Rhodocyclaceae bacterium]